MIGRLLCRLGFHRYTSPRITVELRLVRKGNGHHRHVGNELTWICDREACHHSLTAVHFNSKTARRNWERAE